MPYTTVRVEIDREKARRYGLRVTTPLVVKMGSRILAGAKQRILTRRYDTGRLYRSGRARFVSYTYSVYSYVEFTARHAVLVHRGAKPHLIRPRRRTGLLFYWPAGVGNPPLTEGRIVCYKGTVHHPGMHSEPYLTMPMIIEAAKHRFKVVVYRNYRG